jgi:predicted porin
VYAGLAYNDVRIQNSPNQNRYWVLTGTYDFGFVKPILQVASAKNVSTLTSKSFVVGATAPLGGGVLKVVAASLDPAGADNNTKKFGVGYEYFLSKRTSVHADFGTGKTQNRTRTSGFESGLKHTF